MDFSKYKTLIFDCDGVLLNSNFKKSEAYRFAALDYGASYSQADELVKYHIKNTGVSRYVKFKYFLTDIMMEPYADKNFQFLIDALNKHVLQVLNQCEVTADLDRLRKLTENQHWMVMSGGDQNEVRTLLTQKKIDHFFDYGIYGSPDSKHQIINHHQSINIDFMPALFFGDSEYDITTAEKFSLDFIFVSAWTDFKNWKEVVSKKNIKTVSYLNELII